MTLTEMPHATFHTRVRNDALGGENPFEWKDLTTHDVFSCRKIVLLAVPGAFTPACSNSHLPSYERDFDAYQALGVDAVYCASVNDAFVMFQWARSLGIEKVRMLPDGNGTFAKAMGMLVRRDRQGMGYRSWRYSLYAEDGRIVRLFSEPGLSDNPSGVPVDQSGSDRMLRFLRGENA